MLEKMTMNIMVVDDNLDQAENIAEALGEEGYTATMAFDGKSAVELCASCSFDLAIVDYKLPDMDGLQLQERLSELIDADFLIITAHASIESAAEAVRRKEIVAYETKPLDMDRLLAFVRQIIDRRHAQKKLQRYSEHLEEMVKERTRELEERTRQLQRLAIELTNAEHRERERIALVLHDELQQDLAVLKLKFNILARSGQLRDGMDGHLRQCDAIADEAIHRTRRLVVELSPPDLRRKGFEPALFQLAEHMKDRHGLQVDVDTGAAAIMPDETLAPFLYRSVKELLFNTVKHAGVDAARVKVYSEGDWIAIRVEDSGVGGAVDHVFAQKGADSGFGLFSIEERMNCLGGRMEIHSSPGNGWISTLMVPANAAGNMAVKR